MKLGEWIKNKYSEIQAGKTFTDKLVEMAEGDKDLVIAVLERTVVDHPELTPGSDLFYHCVVDQITEKVELKKRLQELPMPERKTAGELRSLSASMKAPVLDDDELLRQQHVALCKQVEMLQKQIEAQNAAQDEALKKSGYEDAHYLEWMGGGKTPPAHMGCPTEVEMLDIVNEDSIDLNDVEEMV